MEIYPLKGVYKSTEEVIVLIENCKSDKIKIKVYNLNNCVLSKEYKQSKKEISLGYLGEGGYGIIAKTEDGECSCAFDVQDTNHIFRYGFLSDFSSDDKDNSDVLYLAKHHVNAIQFYDWSYRHHKLVSDAIEYTDMMGKNNNLLTIKNKIDEAHKRGMFALGYGAVYAAAKDYADAHPEYRLYGSENKPIMFIDVFAIMNLNSGWLNHIISQYVDAVKNVGFDGIHMDTYGFPKTALDYQGNTIHLENDFPTLIKKTRKALPDAKLVFNNVGNWPVDVTKKEDVDAVYIEVWPFYNTYYHLKEIINNAKSENKPVVIAAYPAAFRLDNAQRALNSEIMLLCTINVHGATQLWFGEENAAITQGYYSDYKKLTNKQEKILRRYEDFFVRYEELFFDNELIDVSLTHAGWDNTEYRFNFNYTVTGEPGKLWAIIREKPGLKLVTIINLNGDESMEWQKGRNDAKTVRNMKMYVEVPEIVKNVFWMDPEKSNGTMQELCRETIDGKKFPELEITIPSIKNLVTVVIETEK
ncbi:MAG: hypothetical protein KBT35_07040 [Firmicutes bacterium]|nr:hypothetical protein [Candidatus Colivicinus equi]